ncbi:hypothetical protein WDW86_03440 [Bdellovibrionota bacterium FG-2]
MKTLFLVLAVSLFSASAFADQVQSKYAYDCCPCTCMSHIRGAYGTCAAAVAACKAGRPASGGGSSTKKCGQDEISAKGTAAKKAVTVASRTTAK